MACSCKVSNPLENIEATRYKGFMELSPYLRLIRLHQPAGILLLLWPCWWALQLAGPTYPSMLTLLLFAIGATLMRGAGCVLNDIVDRDYDAQVERTKDRPLANGELSLYQAQVLLICLLLISFVIAVTIGLAVVLWAALALLPVAIYPWMKRISWWPQLFLGLTFNWGVFMGWAAIAGHVEWPAFLLYAGGVFWTLGYDTVYAHQDKKDDAKIGIKSSALRLGGKTVPYLQVWYAAAALCWMLAGAMQGASLVFYGIMILAAGHLFWQTQEVNLDNPASCRRIFLSNAYYLGPIVFVAMALH